VQQFIWFSAEAEQFTNAQNQWKCEN